MSSWFNFCCSEQIEDEELEIDDRKIRRRTNRDDKADIRKTHEEEGRLSTQRIQKYKRKVSKSNEKQGREMEKQGRRMEKREPIHDDNPLIIKQELTSNFIEKISLPNESFMDIITMKGVKRWLFIVKEISSNQYEWLRNEIKEALVGQLVFDSVRKLEDYVKTQSKTIWKIVIGETLFEEFYQKWTSVASPFKGNIEAVHLVCYQQYLVVRKALEIAKVIVHTKFSQVLTLIKNENLLLSATKIADSKEEEVINQENRYAIIFPNFIPMNQSQKGYLRAYRANVLGLTNLTLFDMKQSQKNFIEYSKKTYGNIYLNDIEDYKEYVNQKGEDNYQESHNSWFLKEYTKDSFYFRIINNTLRMGGQTQNFFAIGAPFNRIFQSIKKMYQQKEHKIKEVYHEDQLVVYRRSMLSKDQVNYLRNNIGGYIETLGFMSTSKDPDVAENWKLQGKGKTFDEMKNKIQIMEIHILPINLKDEKYRKTINGFVDLHLRKLSVRHNEKQVLLNAMNILKIKQNIKESNEGPQRFILQYGSVYQIMQKNVEDLKPQQMAIYTHFMSLEELALKIQSIGDSFMENNKYKQAEKYFDSKIKNQKGSDLINLKLKRADSIMKGNQKDRAEQAYLQILKQNQLDQTAKFEVYQNLVDNYKQLDQLDKLQQIMAKTQAQFAQPTKNTIDQVQMLLGQSRLLLADSQLKGKLLLFDQQMKIYYEVQQIYRKIRMIQSLPPQKVKLVIFKQLQLYSEVANLQVKTIKEKNNQKLSQIAVKFANKQKQIQEYLTLQDFQESVIQKRRLQIQYQQFYLKFISGDEAAAHKGQSIFKSLTSNIQKVMKNLSNQTEQSQEILSDLQLYSSIIRSNPVQNSSSELTARKVQERLLTTNIKLTKSKNHPKVIQSENELALCQRQYRNYEKALIILNQTVSKNVYNKGKNHSTIAKTYYNLGLIYFDRGQLKESLQSYQNALKIYKQLLKNRFQKSEVHRKIQLQVATIYLDRQDIRLESKLKVYKVSVEQKKGKINQLQLAKSHNILGFRFLQSNQPQAAIQNFMIAINAIKQHSGPNCKVLGDTYCNLALALQLSSKKATNGPRSRQEQQKIKHQAIETIKNAEDIYKLNVGSGQDYKYHPYKANIQWYCGVIFKMRRQYQNAIECFEKVQQINKIYEKKSRVKEFQSRLQISMCLLDMNKNDQEVQNYVKKLKQDIEKDLIEKKLWDGYSGINKKQNKIFYILSSLYQLTQDQKIKLIN